MPLSKAARGGRVKRGEREVIVGLGNLPGRAKPVSALHSAQQRTGKEKWFDYGV